MTPSLWPDLVHLPAMLLVLGVAALTVGLGVVVGARRAETALIAGWGTASLATVAVGTLTALPLGPVLLVLGAAGVAGVVWIAVAAARGAPVLRCATVGRVLLLALPLLICIEGMGASGWDDFSHWLPNLAYLCRYGHFPTLAVPSPSDHAAYPYALALPGYAAFLLRGQLAETAAVVWNVLAMLAGAACIAAVLEARLPRTRAAAWGAAAIATALGGLAGPTFVAKIVLSNMADSASGSVLTVLVALVFDWWNAEGRRAQARVALVFGLCCVALVDLRQSNFALFLLLLIGIGLAMLLWRRDGRAAVRALAIAVPLPLLVWGLWGRYAAAQIPGGEFSILPFGAWHWALLGQTLRSIADVLLHKIGLTILLLIMLVRAGLALRRRDRLPPAERAVLLVGVVLGVGNIGFLAFAYLAASFSPQEAAAAASFWRYMCQIGPVAVLALAASLPLDRLGGLLTRRLAIGLVTVTLLVPLATVRLYRHDLASPVPELRRIARDMTERLPPGAPVRLVDLTGSGFAPVVVAYQLWLAGWTAPAHPVSILSAAHGFSAAEARRLSFGGTPQVWLADGAPEMAALFGVPLRAGCAYLLRRTAAGFAIDAAWRLNRFTRPVNDTGWTVRPAGTCD